jgi:ABC-type antimicrobial peptide transport system permease subunit
MESHLGTSLFVPRVAAAALGLFAVLGLLLATLGVYGVVAHAVSLRTREVGIRVALGETPRGVIRLVVGHTTRLTLTGVVAGVAVALVASRAVDGLLYGSAFDPVAFLGAPAFLTSIAVGASWVPALRAARLDPARVLKGDC